MVRRAAYRSSIPSVAPRQSLPRPRRRYWRYQQGSRRMAAQTTALKVQGVKIKLYRAGSGPTVLFLHGAGGVPQWLPFFDKLAERYELLVPEHPGFGGSDNPPWIRSMADLAMFYLDLVEETGLDRIHLIGNSLAGGSRPRS